MLALKELQSLVAYCTDPAQDSFYRRLYKMGTGVPARTVGSLDEWRTFPILSKDDLVAEPLVARSLSR